MSSRINSEQMACTSPFIANEEMSLMDVTENNTKVVRVRKADLDDGGYSPKRARNATSVLDSTARAIIPRTSFTTNAPPSSVMHQKLLTDKLLKRQRDVDLKLKGPQPLERGLLESNLLSKISSSDYEEAIKISEQQDQIEAQLAGGKVNFHQIYMKHQQCQFELSMALQGQTLQESPQEYQARQKRYAVNCEKKWAEFFHATMHANLPDNLSEGVKVALISMNK
ncbi:MAG: hypothetical protein WCG10_03925 [Chlamydiota bacterium]